MTQHDKAKRWRPRFPVRTLVIVVTLVCVYFGCWEATKTWGIPDIPVPAYETSELTSPCPFVIVNPEDMIRIIVNMNVPDAAGYDRQYYFWFFGFVAKLPFERELPIENSPPLDETIKKLKAEVNGGGWEMSFEDTGDVLVWPHDLLPSPQD